MSYSWEPQKVERKELEKVTSTERKRHCVGTWISVRSSQSPAPLISIFLLGTSQWVIVIYFDLFWFRFATACISSSACGCSWSVWFKLGVPNGGAKWTHKIGHDYVLLRYVQHFSVIAWYKTIINHPNLSNTCLRIVTLGCPWDILGPVHGPSATEQQAAGTCLWAERPWHYRRSDDG